MSEVNVFGLLPCPSCHSDLVYFNQGANTQVRCQDCGLEGPQGAKENQLGTGFEAADRAALLWNALPRQAVDTSTPFEPSEDEKGDTEDAPVQPESAEEAAFAEEAAEVSIIIPEQDVTKEEPVTETIDTAVDTTIDGGDAQEPDTDEPGSLVPVGE